MSIPKTHAQELLKELNIKDGLKAFGNKRYEAILKKFRTIAHFTSTYTCNRDEMPQDERKNLTLPNVFEREERWINISTSLCRQMSPDSINR